MIDSAFIKYASDIFAETNTGLSGSAICQLFSEQAVKYAVKIPYSTAPLPQNINKRTAFQKNLECFTPEQQFQIIQSLYQSETFKNNEQARKIYLELVRQYANYAPQDISTELVENVRRLRDWLVDYPEVQKQYESALEKKNAHLYGRNLIDDLRLALELLLKSILKNNKSLENQRNLLGEYLNSKGVSKEIGNLFHSIVFDFLSKFNNERIKHNEDFSLFEVDFIFNQTTVLIQLLIQLDKFDSM